MSFRYTLITLLLCVISSSAFGVNYYSFNYKVIAGDSFSLILQKFVKDEAIINAKNPLVKKIVKNNPKVTDWNNLPPGVVVKLYISDDLMDLEKYKPYETNVLQKVEAIKERKLVSTYPSGLKASVFYMNSSGTFSQSTDAIAINFKQNSPVSIGMAMTFYPKDKPYSTSFSTYYSSLRSPSNSLTEEIITIPPEIGVNLFEEYRWQKRNVTFYGGPDFEKFS